MIARARQTFGPDLPIVLIGPPNLNQSALGPTKAIGKQRESRLKELGNAFEKLAKEQGCDFISLFGAVPEATMTKDGVHPDATGNAAIAKVLGPILLR
jgi:acyl-CoA thioesterase-1